MTVKTHGAAKLLDVVIGAQPTLAKIAQGYGRVATSAHPMCTCYLRTKVLRPEVAAVVAAAASPRPERCHGHDLPGTHECTTQCTATCDCKATVTA